MPHAIVLKTDDLYFEQHRVRGQQARRLFRPLYKIESIAIEILRKPQIPGLFLVF